MQGVIYLFFNNVMATHPGAPPAFLVSGVPNQNLGRRLTSVMTCFSFFWGTKPALGPATHLGNYLLFPSSGVHSLISQWRQLPPLLTLGNNFIAGGVLPPKYS